MWLPSPAGGRGVGGEGGVYAVSYATSLAPHIPGPSPHVWGDGRKN